MKENRKLLKEVIKGIKRDMTDEDVLNLLADSKVSENPNREKDKYTVGQRAADAIAKFAGSWAFIFSFAGLLILWMLANVLLAVKAFDPYPFILLNLALSCVAAVQAPLIMMSQNRQEEKDRRRRKHRYKYNGKKINKRRNGMKTPQSTVFSVHFAPPPFIPYSSPHTYTHSITSPSQRTYFEHPTSGNSPFTL